MLQISEIVKKTEEMFDLFNEHFYDDELTRPAITVSPDGGRGAYRWCSINEIWNASDKKYRAINLCAEYLDRPIFELAATLSHEMAHLYNLVHDIQDVSNNGYYHNMKFKTTAEAHGLHIEKHQKYGWTVTTLAPEAEAWIRETIGESGINASRLQELGTTKSGSKKSKNRSIKYVSPCCDTIIQATREVNVICGDFSSGHEIKGGGREASAKLFLYFLAENFSASAYLKRCSNSKLIMPTAKQSKKNPSFILITVNFLKQEKSPKVPGWHFRG